MRQTGLLRRGEPNGAHDGAAPVPLETAWRVVMAHCRPLPAIDVGLSEALGSVLAADAFARLDVPRFDNSAMDGFAVRSTTVSDRSSVLHLTGTTTAGQAPLALGPGAEAVYVATGAPLPEYADAVVEQELVQFRDDGTISVPGGVAAGRNVRRRGEDVAVGEPVAVAGTTLRARHLAALAAAGVRDVTVHRRPRVAIVSLGNELSPRWEELGPGEIPDSNRYFLRGALAEADCEVVDGGSVGDDPARTAAVIAALADAHDAVVSTGGLGVGPLDVAALALSQLGPWRAFTLAVKPAKPFAFGTVGAAPVFCLPGNPVSAMVAFELLARPGLRLLAGRAADGHLRLRATADGTFSRRRDGKRHFLRGQASVDVDGHWSVRPVSATGSHQVVGTARANCLVVLDDGEGAAPGDAVTLILLSGWEPDPVLCELTDDHSRS
jgi:molybdopterin molybdotransferase